MLDQPSAMLVQQLFTEKVQQKQQNSRAVQGRSLGRLTLGAPMTGGGDNYVRGVLNCALQPSFSYNKWVVLAIM